MYTIENYLKEKESKGKIKNYPITIVNDANYDKDRLNKTLKFLSNNLDKIRKEIVNKLMKNKKYYPDIKDKLDYKKFIPTLLGTTLTEENVHYELHFNSIPELGEQWPEVRFKNDKIRDIVFND